MKRCLSERTLWLIHEGAAREQDTAHLEGCLDCTARYRHIDDDLGEITRALRDHPSPIRRPARRGRRRWITAAAIVAGFGLLAGGEAILWRESKALVDPRPETTAEALSLLEEVTLLLSSPGVTAASVLVSDPATVIAEMASQESYEDEPIAGGGGRL
jgi:ferric-dicitrate binding protein FerR (iron transport regulator)